MDETFNKAFDTLKGRRTSKDYENEILKLKEENFDLKTQLMNTKGSAIDNKDINKSCATVDFNNVLMDSKKALQKLESQNQDLKRELLIYQQNSPNLQTVINENLKLVKYSEKIRQETENIKRDLINERNVLINEIYDLKEELKGIKNMECSKYEEIKRAYKSKEIECQELSEAIKDCNMKYQIKDQGLMGVQERLQCEVSAMNELRHAFNVKENECANYQLQSKQLTDKINLLVDDLNFKNGECEGLRLQSHEMQEKLKILYDQKSNECIKQQEECYGLKSRIVELEGEVLKYTNELRREALNINEYNVNYVNIKKLLEKEIAEKNEYMEHSMHIEKQLEAVRKGEAYFSEDIAKKNESIKSLRNELAEKEEVIARYGNEIRTLKREIENIRNENINIGNKLYDHAYENKTNGQHDNFYKENVNNKSTNNGINHQVNKQIENLNARIEVYKRNETKLVWYYNTQKMALSETRKFVKAIHTTLANIYDKISILRSKTLNMKPIVNKENRLLLRRTFPNQSNINIIIPECIRTIKKLSDKINILENDSKQLARFAENNAKIKQNELCEIFDDFKIEFQGAKNELEYCKNYLKEKSREIKNIRTERVEYVKKIQGLEEEIGDLKKKKGVSWMYRS